MKYISLTATGLLVTLAFIGCKNDADKEAQVNEATEEVQNVKDSAVTEKERYADAGVDDLGSIEKPTMPDDYSINWDQVDVDPKLKADVDGWKNLKTFSNSVKALDLKEVPQAEIKDYITQLEEEASNLETTIPKSLLTEEVQEDLKDIKEEVADLKAIIAKSGTDKNKIENQVEELMEAYADLNEELKETVYKNGKTILDDNQ